MRTYSPKIDLVFRKLFGTEENKDLLLSLINAIIEPFPHLTNLTIKNPYNLATYAGGKMSVLDIKAVDGTGTWYDIEMQIGEHGSYGKRALYYLSKMYVDQLEEGAGYGALNKTIGIHLIDFDYFFDDRYRRHFVYKDMETNEYVEHLSYHQLYFIEMQKFRKDLNELTTVLDRWITFLNRATKLTLNALPESLQVDAEIVRAAHRLEVLGFNAQELTIYETELKARLDDQEELRTATEKGHNSGVAEGEAIGRAAGRAEGLSEALSRLIASGMSEQQAKTILQID